MHLIRYGDIHPSNKITNHVNHEIGKSMFFESYICTLIKKCAIFDELLTRYSTSILFSIPYSINQLLNANVF